MRDLLWIETSHFIYYSFLCVVAFHSIPTDMLLCLCFFFFFSCNVFFLCLSLFSNILISSFLEFLCVRHFFYSVYNYVHLIFFSSSCLYLIPRIFNSHHFFSPLISNRLYPIFPLLITLALLPPD